MSKRAVVESFNRIAQLSTEHWNHNSHYHPYLLRRLSERREAALDIGSGLGEFSRLLAQRFDQVEGIDFSPRMVELAASRSTSNANLHYCCDDFLEKDYQDNSLDCVASLATLHHMELRQALGKVKRILRPGGRLLALDLYHARTMIDYVVSTAGVFANPVRKALRGRGHSKELRRAWAEHGRLDHYLSIGEIRRICREVLPNARIRRHIYFRYSLFWEKE